MRRAFVSATHFDARVDHGVSVGPSIRLEPKYRPGPSLACLSAAEFVWDHGKFTFGFLDPPPAIRGRQDLLPEPLGVWVIGPNSVFRRM